MNTGQPIDPISLLLSHPQGLIVILGLVGWVFGQITKRGKEARRPANPARARPGGQAAALDPEERSRRVREEVRRKIAARTLASPTLAPRPVASPLAGESALGDFVRRRFTGLPSDGSSVPAGTRAEGEAGRDTVREAPVGKRPAPAIPASKTVVAVEAATAGRPKTSAAEAPPSATYATGTTTLPVGPVSESGPVPGLTGSTRARAIGTELRSTSGARRAVILREVFGPPVGLRQ